VIKIIKSGISPVILTNQGSNERTLLCNFYNGNPARYRLKFNRLTNPYKFEFKASVYGHKTVKEKLIKEQHDKCCFCEGSFLENSYGDVEHFRPKGGYKQNINDPIGKPGYYWLAYDWENLMFSCQICNQQHKKNLFPLSPGTTRQTCHTEPNELLGHCLLVSPVTENPELHISFNDYVPIGITAKGKKSITSYGLKRTRLNEARIKHLRIVAANLVLSKIDISELSEVKVNEIKFELGISTTAELQTIVDSAITFRNECAKDTAIFANMIRAKYPHLPR